MFKEIWDIMAHWYDIWNWIVNAINFRNAKIMVCELMFNVSNQYGIKCKKMKCALMFNISNHYGIKSLSNPLLLEPCNVMFLSDFWHNGTLFCKVKLNYYCNEFVQCKENDLCIDVIINNHYVIKFLSNIL